MSREEAAAKAFHGALDQPVSTPADWEEEIAAALAAADAYDEAHNIYRIECSGSALAAFRTLRGQGADK